MIRRQKRGVLWYINVLSGKENGTHFKELWPSLKLRLFFIRSILKALKEIWTSLKCLNYIWNCCLVTFNTYMADINVEKIIYSVEPSKLCKRITWAGHRSIDTCFDSVFDVPKNEAIPTAFHHRRVRFHFGVYFVFMVSYLWWI